MRNVALDLGNRIAFCEVAGGQVIRRTTVGRLENLLSVLGPQTPPAQVAVEACREVWAIERTLRAWGHTPIVVDTTRARQLGIGQHKRKNDRIDAEVLARAAERGALPVAHVLSPHRQSLRLHLGVRRILVATRAQYVTAIRGLARAHGVRLDRCGVEDFGRVVREHALPEETRMLISPLETMLDELDVRVAQAERKLESLSAQEPVCERLMTAPGVGPVVTAAFVSVIDDAVRFKRAHDVESYVGLVPSEDTSGKRRLGAITKQGNGYLRAVLLQAAWTVLRRRDEDPLTRWGQAILERRGKRIAAVAVARRLVGILWAMWRDGTVYDAERLGRASATGLRGQAQTIEHVAAAVERAGRKQRRRQQWIERLLQRRSAQANQD